MPGNRKLPKTAYKKGESGNPIGRPALPPEVKALLYEPLAVAVRIMNEKVNDQKYMGKLRPGELQGMLSLVFDRCGLPKLTQAEISGKDGMAISFTLSMGDKVPK